MINIVTKIDANASNIIVDNEDFFFRVVIFSEIKEAAAIIKSIDNAKIISLDKGLIDTPFGITNVDNLSTGCKTALNVAYLNLHPEIDVDTVSLVECGKNAIDCIFKMDSNIKFYMKNSGAIFKIEDKKFSIDGVVSDSLLIL